MITIRNTGNFVPNEGQRNTDQKKAFEGTVRVVLEGVEYCVGHNATLTLEDRLANMALAQNSNLKLDHRS